MSHTASPKLGGYAGLTALGLIAALALGRAELVVLAAPFAVLLLLGLALAAEPEVKVWLTIDRERALEREEAELELEISSPAALERVEVTVALPAGLALARGPNPAALRLRAGEEQTVELGLRCDHWGAYRVGEVSVRVTGRLGLVVYESQLDLRSSLKVYPHAETLRSLLRPLETQVFAGNQVTRTKGEGIEFADIRPFAPGDRIRRINWRASARRDALWVNESHPERNADVILFLDTFAEARKAGGSTLDLAVRAAGSLAFGYLGNKDRVGVVGFGGILNWLVPATGLVQLYRVVDSLLDAEIMLSYAWKDIDLLPARTLPPKALVVALSPLLDERTVKALLNLRARGFDLAVVEIAPSPFTEPGADELDELAWRVWELRRAALRYRYERLGVPVVEWRDGTPVQSVIEEVTAYRRHARFVHA